MSGFNFFAEVDARQLPFQRPAQVLHGAVQQLRVGGIGHDAKVQIDARGATVKQIQQLVFQLSTESFALTTSYADDDHDDWADDEGWPYESDD